MPEKSRWPKYLRIASLSSASLLSAWRFTLLKLDRKFVNSTMSCALAINPFDFLRPLIPDSRKASRIVTCSSSGSPDSIATEILGNDGSWNGRALEFEGPTSTLVSGKLLSSPKKITLLRHGLSSWNKENRIQGSSNMSILTEAGVAQAERCRMALSKMHFDLCFSSPISRAKTTAEILWEGREQPMVFLDSLKEAQLYFLEGMKNVDAKKMYPEEFNKWREDPSNFHVNGIYPIRELWKTAREAWLEILFTPGENFLVVTHKSILRALICTALGLGPHRFRAFDIDNGGLTVFSFNERGETMLQNLNMTSHMHTDHLYHY